MSTLLGLFGSFWWVGAVLLLAVFWRAAFALLGVIIIDQDEIGIVNLKFNLFGKNKTLPDGKIIALNGEAGWQADTLAPGLHFGYFRWQYKIQRQKFITVSQGTVGVLEARDGNAIPAGSVLAKAVACDSFQNARAFLQSGGQRGPQLAILPPGTYRINTSLFSVEMKPATKIEDNTVGIVTTREGQPLPANEIAGKPVADHNLFQDAQKFLNNGGYKGLQEQVILAGLYYLNPLFVTVETKLMTEISIGFVGVVIAYVGAEDKTLGSVDPASSVKDKQIRIVKKGCKGVWDTPLDPGKYPINPYTHLVVPVPTTNIVLNWAQYKSEAHKLDEHLTTIQVRSKDGFGFTLDVAQIIHIPRENAPKVIARFGNMLNLVSQVLEPSIGNYFRNSAQAADVIDFLSKRAERQEEAKKHIVSALNEYDVQGVDTLIGNINPPEALMTTLTDRKVAEQQKLTFDIQKLAQDARQDLQNSTALADTKPEVVGSLRRVEIETNLADAAVNKADGEARAKIKVADADNHVFTVTGQGKAAAVLAVGNAEAEVLGKKVGAVGKEGYVGMQIADYLAANKIQLVPNFLVQTGDGKSGGSGIADALIGFMMANAAGMKMPGTPAAVAAPAPAAAPAAQS
ncbi:flotillin family protein [Candidatus Kaiserbacteria bacterium]|nr:flotillin family protein [Candidatus Kaiserbacteria bacterium]